ncbi:aspartic peptidase domain-containing protein [Xylariaceae sp. FL0804]|nr:aspartic peptidase domain-containing protein [Xylariaceae sp. FL0804]
MMMIRSIVLSGLTIASSAAVAAAANAEVHRLGARNVRLPITRGALETRPDPGAAAGGGAKGTNISQSYPSNSPYTVEFNIGSPPQLVYLAIDPYSRELWVDPDCDGAYSTAACWADGFYLPSASQTAQSRNCTQPWDVAYLSGGASGCYYVDRVEFSGFTADMMQFGVAEQSWEVSAGVMGMGFGGGPNVSGTPTFLDRMVEDGFVPGYQFSVSLGGVDDNDGEILFSGINTGKYSNWLQKVPRLSAGDLDPSLYYLPLSGVGYTMVQDGCLSSLERPISPPYPAVLDFGAPTSSLPAELVAALVEGFGDDAVYNATEQAWRVGCQHRRQNATVDFAFAGGTVRISVRNRDFLPEMIVGDGDVCYLGATAVAAGGPAVLGANFLRAAYVVFDGDSDSVYMAQYVDCGYHVVDFNAATFDHELGQCVNDLVPDQVGCTTSSISYGGAGTSTLYPPPHSSHSKSPPSSSRTGSSSAPTTHSSHQRPSASTYSATYTTTSATNSHWHPTYTTTARSHTTVTTTPRARPPTSSLSTWSNASFSAVALTSVSYELSSTRSSSSRLQPSLSSSSTSSSSSPAGNATTTSSARHHGSSAGPWNTTASASHSSSFSSSHVSTRGTNTTTPHPHPHPHASSSSPSSGSSTKERGTTHTVTVASTTVYVTAPRTRASDTRDCPTGATLQPIPPMQVLQAPVTVVVRDTITETRVVTETAFPLRP